jgi:uncharacterized protein YdcH (DUF465 family)
VEKRRYSTSPFECVIALHPAKADLIRRLLMANSDFRQLCDDYRQVTDTIAQLDAIPETTSREIHSDYVRLRHDLAADITSALERLATP